MGEGELRRSSAAFTLIEIMVAVGIMAVFMTIGIPKLFQNMHQDSMRKAVSDIMEVCATARARAILDGGTTVLRIRPHDRSFSVGAASQTGDQSSMGVGAGLPERNNYQFGDRMRQQRAAPNPAASGNAAKLSSFIIVEGLGVNGEDWTEDEEAQVRFYPNGTCDAMSIVLLSDKGERRNIYLEVVTGFAELEVDTFKFRAR